MKKANKKITLLSVISSIILQISSIISGFIIPRIIISYFGSETNGLISSINQFLSYISLIEGGVTSVITASLYKPLVKKDEKKISSIIATTNRFYRKIGMIFLVYCIGVAILYPLLFDLNFSYFYTCILTLVLSINLFIQYMFSLTLRTLLNADKKVYIVSITQTVIIILNIILAIISVNIYPNIFLLKIISCVLFTFQPIIFSIYIKKNYNIDKKAKVDNDLLKNRWNGFAINIAYFIHSSTDITLLTIFTDLKTVSIYSIYALVTNGLKSVINSIANGLNPTIGQTLATGDDNETLKKLNIYEFIIFILVYYIFSVALLLIVPFVMIYTKGITDTNYYQPLFGTLILLSEALYLLKLPHVNLAYAANKFKEITIPAFVEAVLNIVISIILVNKIGIIGVAIGTIIAMLYRLIFHVSYTKKIIKSYSIKSFYKKFILFSIISFIGIVICSNCISPISYNLSSWCMHSIVYSLIMAALFIVLSVLFYKKEILYIKKYLIKK